jgi:hypothetical protein
MRAAGAASHDPVGGRATERASGLSPAGPAAALPTVPAELTLGASLSFEVLVAVGLTGLFRAFDAPAALFASVTGISQET